MTFSNIATKKILNGVSNNESGAPLGDGFPFLKYAWEVEFQIQGKDPIGLNTTGKYLGPLVAKTCELPRWSIDTQVVNVYNHKTLVQTKLNYETITVTLYDQTNNVAESLIWDFFKGQFDVSDGSKIDSFAPMTVTIKMKNLSGNGAEDKVYRLENTYIVDAQHDTLDYSASEVVNWTLTLRFEDLTVDPFLVGSPKKIQMNQPAASPAASPAAQPAEPPQHVDGDAQGGNVPSPGTDWPDGDDKTNSNAFQTMNEQSNAVEKQRIDKLKNRKKSEIYGTAPLRDPQWQQVTTSRISKFRKGL